MFSLRCTTAHHWIKAVLDNFNAFLIDHAAAEKKASGMAISMLSHYPDRKALVSAMIDLAIEEMTHFRQVIKILDTRGLTLGADTRDAYVGQLRKLSRKGSDDYFLDRLVLGGIIEARGCERFGIVAAALKAGELKKFYTAIAASEARHEHLFIELAMRYFPERTVNDRLDELLDEEARICQSLPIVAALH